MKSYRIVFVRMTAFACLATLLGGCNNDRVEECLEYYHAPLIQAICMGTEAVPDVSGIKGESNTTFDNATVLSTSDLSIEGSVLRHVDNSDFYIFTPARSGPYRIGISEGGSDEAATSDAVYLMLYDQTRTTLVGTPIGVVERQELAAELTAGVAYYVEVNGYNADTFAYSYRLTIDAE